MTADLVEPSANAPPRRRLRLVAVAAGLLVLVAAAFALVSALRFPPDTTPEGAYMRIARAVSLDETRVIFAYLEDDAQHAAYSIRDYRARASELVASRYPEPERTRLLDAYRTHASAPDGADVFLDLAERNGWIARLRRDMSGVGMLDKQGPRATIETVHGTRYTFRERENGIWGMTLFTAPLLAESERAARDWEVVERAAADYARGR